MDDKLYGLPWIIGGFLLLVWGSGAVITFSGREKLFGLAGILLGVACLRIAFSWVVGF